MIDKLRHSSLVWLTLDYAKIVLMAWILAMIYGEPLTERWLHISATTYMLVQISGAHAKAGKKNLEDCFKIKE